MNRLTPAVTVRRLFWRRWLDHVRQQASVLHAVIDAVVFLYIGVPAVLLLGRAYIGLWREALPEWILQLPAAAVPGLLLLLLHYSKGLILFIEPADSLFLRQERRWMRGLIIRAVIMGSLTAYVRLTLIILLLAPILVRGFSMEWGELLQMLAGLCAFQTVANLLDHLIRVNHACWKRWIWLSLSGTTVTAAFLVWYYLTDWQQGLSWLIPMGCLGLSAVLISLRLRLQGRLESELREELRGRTRLTALLLSQSVPPPKPERSRPWLFRGSRRLLRSSLPGDRAAELTVKSFFRGQELQTYAGLTLLGCLAVIIPPFPVNLIVYLGLVLLLSHGVNESRKFFFRSSLMGMLCGAREAEATSSARTMKLLLFPALMLMTCFFFFSITHAWWGILPGMAAGYAVSLAAGSMAPVFFSTGFRRMRKPRS